MYTFFKKCIDDKILKEEIREKIDEQIIDEIEIKKRELIVLSFLPKVSIEMETINENEKRQIMKTLYYDIYSYFASGLEDGNKRKSRKKRKSVMKKRKSVKKSYKRK